VQQQGTSFAPLLKYQLVAALVVTVTTSPLIFVCRIFIFQDAPKSIALAQDANDSSAYFKSNPKTLKLNSVLRTTNLTRVLGKPALINATTLDQ